MPYWSARRTYAYAAGVRILMRVAKANYMEITLPAARHLLIDDLEQSRVWIWDSSGMLIASYRGEDVLGWWALPEE